jgi:hypothetical protein
VPDQAPKETKRKTPFVTSTALEIAQQVDDARTLLINGNRPPVVRQILREKWGLETRTAERRLTQARQEMVKDISGIDRQQYAAQLVEAAAEIQKAAQDTRQLSNALGALRLQAEILGVTGRSN